ncbi:MAG: adenylosuccinate lyase [Candidatus Rokubacteria bacterium RIFCSPHIGHO2_02_FULL_73_26]|nr:MAG: adenylosuccinate lyase [Candidatus Rokubacteria bacterium RIFCSPHIGHO2_02_FULL_73_26]
MPSHVIDFHLFGDQFSTSEMRAVFDERAMLQRWLDVEAALAAAQAELGLIPAEAAGAIAAAAHVDKLDLAAVKRDLGVTAHPIVPLVRELGRVAGDGGRWVHWGATTQDILDTGMALQLRAAHSILRRDTVTLLLELSDLAELHRDTLMAGRTHAQQALPITFGFKVATWVAECVRQVERLDEAAPRLFVGQLAGAVGTLAGFGPRGEAVQRTALARLGLGAPPIAWHASRDTISEFVVLLALIGATLARIANEVIQLQRSEIMELEEPFAPGTVGSSTMPHKRNPAHAERIVAIGRLLRGLATTALETAVAAHERDMSVGRAEWVLVPEAACLAAGALHWSLAVIRGLTVNTARMKENLHRLGGLLLSEPIMLRLAETLGRHVAHDLVYEAAMAAFEGRGSFRDLLLADPRARASLDDDDLDRLLDPAASVGLAGSFVDRVVHEARRLNA